MNVKLMRYDAYYGRCGSLHGMFLATQADLDQLNKVDTIYLGECLGKYSAISLEAEDIHLVTENAFFINLARGMGIDLEIGINPLEYIE